MKSLFSLYSFGRSQLDLWSDGKAHAEY
jgi:hypothetical protein